MKPGIGETVHYVSFGTPGGEYSRECRAAIVTEIQDDPRMSVGLCVLNPAGQFFNRAVPRDDGRPDQAGGTNLCGGLDFRGGTWHWPERTAEARTEITEGGFEPTSQAMKRAGIRPGDVLDGEWS